nr:uncharacterized protein LOC117278002 [Nicotiana tomentosiformis]
MLELLRLQWRGSSITTSSRVVSFLKARHMIEKVCLAYLAYVRDTAAETPTIDSVSMVREFSYVFPSDLPSMPPYRDIDFCIDLVPDADLIQLSTAFEIFLVQIHPLVSRYALSSSLNLSRPSQPHNLINKLAPKPIPPSQFVLVSIALLISPCTAGCRKAWLLDKMPQDVLAACVGKSTKKFQSVVLAYHATV